MSTQSTAFSALPNEEPAMLPIELGFILAGAMDDASCAAVAQAADQVTAALREAFPRFAWRSTLIARHDVVMDHPAEPVGLVDVGVFERDAARLDFVFVVTTAPLRSHDRPIMLGAPAQAVDVAVLSTARLGLGKRADGASDSELAEAQRVARVVALALHLFGHLNDLPHAEEPQDYMYPPNAERDLDAMRRFSEACREQMLERLEQVADPRMEETGHTHDRVAFYLKAMWLNRGEVISGVRRIAPWQFPYRYSKLTAAAASTELILIMTAEAWELGMSQPGLRVALLSLLALLGTSIYLLKRQHLLAHLGHRMSEQRVITATAVTVGVLLGMATTYALLFATTWLVAMSLFSAPVVAGWAASIPSVGYAEYLVLAGFVASVGLLFGALGASLEQETYFRRVAMLDEET